jgi:hypothetical protein
MLFSLIPTKLHATLDYLTALTLPLLPRMLNLDKEMTRYHDTLAAATLAYSASTDYELGLIKTLPMHAHLAFDLIGGLTLLSTAALATDHPPRARNRRTTLGLIYLTVPLLSQPHPPRAPTRAGPPSSAPRQRPRPRTAATHDATR